MADRLQASAMPGRCFPAVRRQFRSAGTLLAAKTTQHIHVPPVDKRVSKEYPSPAGGAAEAAPERGALACPSARTSTSTRCALVAL
jgi:hypothetical protein